MSRTFLVTCVFSYICALPCDSFIISEINGKDISAVKATEIEELRTQNSGKRLPSRCRTDQCREQAQGLPYNARGFPTGEVTWAEVQVGQRVHVACPYDVSRRYGLVRNRILVTRDCLTADNGTASEWGNTDAKDCPGPPLFELVFELNNRLSAKASVHTAITKTFVKNTLSRISQSLSDYSWTIEENDVFERFPEVLEKLFAILDIFREELFGRDGAIPQDVAIQLLFIYDYWMKGRYLAYTAPESFLSDVDSLIRSTDLEDGNCLDVILTNIFARCYNVSRGTTIDVVEEEDGDEAIFGVSNLKLVVHSSEADNGTAALLNYTKESNRDGCGVCIGVLKNAQRFEDIGRNSPFPDDYDEELNGVTIVGGKLSGPDFLNFSYEGEELTESPTLGVPHIFHVLDVLKTNISSRREEVLVSSQPEVIDDNGKLDWNTTRDENPKTPEFTSLFGSVLLVGQSISFTMANSDSNISVSFQYKNDVLEEQCVVPNETACGKQSPAVLFATTADCVYDLENFCMCRGFGTYSMLSNRYNCDDHGFGGGFDLYDELSENGLYTFLGFPSNTYFKIVGQVLHLVSFLCLLATVVCFLCVKVARKSRPSRILVQLCLALMCEIAVMITTGEIYLDDNACAVANVARYYFMLVCLCWNSVEGLNMYLMLVKVFKSDINRFLTKAALFAYGFPALFVCIAFLADTHAFHGFYEVYEDDPHRNTAYCIFKCRLQNNMLYFAFILPMVTILAFNLAVFALVLKVVSSNNQTLDKRTRKQKQSKLWKAVSVLFLLGIPWLFGAFASLDSEKVELQTIEGIFQVVFLVLVSFQGPFFLIFQCCGNSEIRRELKRMTTFRSPSKYTDSVSHPPGTNPSSILSKSDDHAGTTTAATIKHKD